MSMMSHVFEPQNMRLGFEVWFLILLIVTFTTYGLRLVTGLPVALLAAMLISGGYAGNVVARAIEWVPATTNITGDIVLQSANACFGGMMAVMAVWCICKLVAPLLSFERQVDRRREPKAVVGSAS
jgi:hypothetical protein